MNTQKGFINLDLEPLFWMAGIGLVAVIIGLPWGLYEMWQHLSISWK